MATVFISYRRSDAAPYAGRLYDRLTRRFGDDAIFMDIDDIELGADFPNVIAGTLARTEVVLVLIGPGWAGAQADGGRRRLDDPADFVRQEVQAAIRLNKRIVPVLVGGAAMPQASDLPPQLAALPRYNALELGDARFEADFARLMEALDPPGNRRPPGADFVRGPARRRILAGAFVVVLLAAAGWWLAPGLLKGNTAAKPAKADGNWVAAVTYGWGATHEERFVFTTSESQLLGAAGFLGVARPVVGGSVDGNHISFSTRTQEMLGRDTRDLLHTYRGTIEGDTIRFLLVTEGGNSGGPVEFTARRVP
jgi:hypothetical protein